MDTEKLAANSKVRVACTCDDFKFRWAYILYQRGALLHPNRFVLEPPKITNPNMEINACKHIHTFIKNEFNKGLKIISKVQDKL